LTLAPYVDGIREWVKGTKYGIDPSVNLLTHEYTPLALAATYRLHELVNLLISRGADVSRRVEGKFSVLQEYLLPYRYRVDTLSYVPDNDPSLVWWSDIFDRSCAMNLLSQGAGVWDHEPCDRESICVCHKSACKNDRFKCYPVCEFRQFRKSLGCVQHPRLECYSTLDFAILTGDQHFVEDVIKAGGQPTRHSLELALWRRLANFDLFFSILKLNPPVPGWAVFKDSSDLSPDWYPTKFQKYLLTMVASVQLGEDLFFQQNLEEDDPEITLADKCNALKTMLWKCSYNNFRGVPDRIRHIVRSWITKNQVPEPARSSILGLFLIFALRDDDLTEAYTLLNSGADVNACLACTPVRSRGIEWNDSSHIITLLNPLQLAIFQQNHDLVTKLLNAGANINHPEHGNLLVSAIALGVESHVIQALLPHASLCLPGSVGVDLWCDIFQCRVDPDIWDILEEHDCSPLAAAIFTKRWDVAEDILYFMESQRGVGLSGSRFTAEASATISSIWAAVWRENPRLVRRLLDYGADPNDEDALGYAAAKESSDCLDQLLECLTAPQRRGDSNKLHIALVSAIKAQRWDHFNKILKAGIVDLDLMVEVKTPLGHIIGHEELQLHQRATLAASLLEAGANINAICKGCLGYYPPHTVFLEAIKTRNIQLMNLLLSDPRINLAHMPDQVPYTPLQLAADTNCPEIVQLLLAHGHNPNLFRDPEHFRYCWESDKYYRCGTSVQVATTAGNAEILEMLLQHNANPNPTTRLVPHTALQIACRDGHMKLVELLIEYGANVNAPPAHTNGATALQFAAIGGYLGIAQFLLDKGADVNAPGAREGGRTALEGAAEHGRLDMVQLLKNAGVDLLSKQWETAVELATKNGHYAVRELLYSFFQQDLDTDV
jgi:ankyrin repeat protein